MDRHTIHCPYCGERLEVAVLSRKKGEKLAFTIFTDAELAPYIADAESLRKMEEEEKEAARKARSGKD